MKKAVGRTLIILITLIVLLSLSTTAYAESYYIHDPMQNPKAAADIIVDPNAVYGYAPNPDSKRLGPFAQYDWSDEAFVAQMKEEREKYHESFEELYQIKANMEAEGKSIEEIARAVSTRRNEIRMEFYKDDPEGLEKLKESNLATFGNENGGTPEYFYAKYGSWERVIEKAFDTNEGADAVLGLYDKYYDTYIIDDEEQTPTEESTTAPDPTEAPTETSKSPNTGDISIMLIGIIVMMTGVAVLCVIALKKTKE